MNLECSSNDCILLVWSNKVNSETIGEIVDKINLQIKPNGILSIENSGQLLNNQYPDDHFNKIFVGYIDNEPKLKLLHDDIYYEFSRILKRKGELFIKKSNKEDCMMQAVIRNIKFSGLKVLEEKINFIHAQKPDFEVGTVFDIISGDEVKDQKKIWEQAASGLLKDDDLIDEDLLITEDDLKKPDPSSLRVCGSTGKRKACANCTCGLAEQLENEELEKIKSNTQNAKSSCGSCYLGDAFRCASCPYRGLPAFKPGEKIILDNTSDL